MNPEDSAATEAVRHALAALEKAEALYKEAKGAVVAALDMLKEEDRQRNEDDGWLRGDE